MSVTVERSEGVRTRRRSVLSVLSACLILGSGSAVTTLSLSVGPVAGAAASEAVGDGMVVGPARLEPISGEVDLAAEVAGVLAQLPIHEGDQVSKGKIIAELNNQDAMSRVDQAAATLQIQTALLDKLKNGARVQERRQAVSAIDEQNATLNRLQRDLTRQKLLFSRGYASNAQLEQAESAQRVALAKRNSSSEALAQIDAGPRSEDVVAAEAEVQLAKAQLAEARVSLEKTRVRAPFDGTILRLYKHLGESVTPGTAAPILQIGDLQRIVARTQIDEADIARVAKGAKAYVTAAAYPGARFRGVVTDISPRLGAKTIQTGAPAEKRDASVLDVLVTLDPGTTLPMGLRMDCYIEAMHPTQ